jgi:hypothetical protein
MMQTNTLISQIRWQGNTRTLAAAAAGGGAANSGRASQSEEMKTEHKKATY